MRSAVDTPGSAPMAPPSRPVQVARVVLGPARPAVMGRGSVLVPLYAFVKGDTLGIVALVQDSDTIARLASIIADAASTRIVPRAEMVVRANGKRLEPFLTIAAS